MNLNQLDLVAWSLARVEACREAPARLFLSRLTVLDPKLSRLFVKDRGHAWRALGRVHLLALAGFRGAKATTVLRSFSRRCRQLGIDHLEQSTILSAALWTLQRVLGPGFRLADRQAWVAYQERLVRMLSGGEGVGRQSV